MLKRIKLKVRKKRFTEQALHKLEKIELAGLAETHLSVSSSWEKIASRLNEGKTD
jgi:hypothetical protein